MADNDVGGGLVSRRHGQDVQVGPADAAGFDLDQDIAGLVERRHRPMLVDQPAFAFEYRHAHHSFSPSNCKTARVAWSSVTSTSMALVRSPPRMARALVWP